MVVLLMLWFHFVSNDLSFFMFPFFCIFSLELFLIFSIDIKMRKIRSFYFTLAFILALLLSANVFAAEKSGYPALHKAIAGVFIHDRGPTSDAHEHGIDPNLEIQFNPPDGLFWQKIRLPYPTIGITPNFYGDTSIVYGGLTYERDITDIFFAGSLGAALHNGPLHKDEDGCYQNSDCGFGWRVLPHLSAELGYNIRKNYGVSVFYDHMSHKEILPGENEGIDHIGFRYFYIFR